MLGKKSKAPREDLPPTVESASTGSPGYAKDYSIGALRERRLLMTVKVVCLGLFASLTLNLVQAFLMVSMLPLKEVRPFLVQITDGGSVAATIKPIEDTFEAKDILTEKLVREYVITRHEILRSVPVMQDRWSGTGYIGMTSTQEEYRRFANSQTTTLNEIRAAGAERRAKIQSVVPVRVGKVYVVDFLSESFDQRGNLIDSRVYTATLEIDFQPLKDLTREQMLINPTGFLVTNYSLAEKDQ